MAFFLWPFPKFWHHDFYSSSTTHFFTDLNLNTEIQSFVSTSKTTATKLTYRRANWIFRLCDRFFFCRKHPTGNQPASFLVYCEFRICSMHPTHLVSGYTNSDCRPCGLDAFCNTPVDYKAFYVWSKWFGLFLQKNDLWFSEIGNFPIQILTFKTLWHQLVV